MVGKYQRFETEAPCAALTMPSCAIDIYMPAKWIRRLGFKPDHLWQKSNVVKQAAIYSNHKDYLIIM